MRRLFVNLAAMALAVAAPCLAFSGELEDRVNAEIEIGRQALNRLELQLRETDPNYAKKREILVPILQPLFAKLQPDEWAGAFLEAYNKLPASATSQAEKPKKMPIFVETSADSSVGRQLAFKIKEGLRQSAGMELALGADDALLRLVVVALDINDGISTTYSAVWTMRDVHRGVWLYLDSEVGHCGWTRVGDCADTIVAVTDERAFATAQALQKSLKTGQ